MFNYIAQLSRSKKGMWLTLGIWLLVTVGLTFLAPGSRDEVSIKEGTGLPDDSLIEQANQVLDESFPGDESIPAILVMTSDEKLGTEELESISETSRQIEAAEIKTIKELLPLHNLPPQALGSFLSEDGTSIFLPINLKAGLDSDAISESITAIEEIADKYIAQSLTYEMTGPAAISSDTVKLFEQADLVLILATVALILVLLIVIYRSPLLAIIPLLACGIVYQVTDRVLGLAGQAGLFLDAQTLSIMAILLFAAITDYSLFVFARFREELKVTGSKYRSMTKAMTHVSEPIFFSGTTVIAAVLMLFFASDEAYRNFAPVFAIAMLIIVIGGLTLVPALFTLFGRTAFWPFIPKPNEQEKEKETIWHKIGSFVVKKPGIISILVTAVLVVFAYNITSIQYNYNLLKSFPENMESRVGFEILEEKYSPGSLAPTTVLLTADEGEISGADLAAVVEELESKDGVEGITPAPEALAADPSSALSKNGKAAKVDMTLAYNPYSEEAIETISLMQDEADEILEDSGATNLSLLFAGETALQVDLDRANDRDTPLIVGLVTIFITIMLGLLTRSVIAPLYMMATILLSYFTALGLGVFLLDTIFGIDSFSSRIPLYTFVFSVALGVDYNIMLVSRIQEEIGRFSLKEAVSRGITYTGGVISSAGLILAATFAVLTTQPIMELFTFGFIVAIGVLIDTFIVRTLLVPSIIVLLGKWSFWPFKKDKTKSHDITQEG
ncbi:MAG: MMPL family transporter [Bacillus sp. (in: firmicutes)]